MTYAAQLIDAVKTARELKTYRALADELGITEQALSGWRRGHGSPMPPERVMQLCELAHIADPGPWLIGVQSDAVRITGVRKALESVLDRLRPTVAAVGILVGASLGYSAPTQAAPAETAPSMHIMSIRRAWTRWLAALRAFRSQGAPAWT